jgi:hypothetical protein
MPDLQVKIVVGFRWHDLSSSWAKSRLPISFNGTKSSRETLPAGDISKKQVIFFPSVALSTNTHYTILTEPRSR